MSNSLSNFQVISDAIDNYVEGRLENMQFHPDRRDDLQHAFRNWMFFYIKQQLRIKKMKKIRTDQVPVALQIILQEKSRFNLKGVDEA